MDIRRGPESLPREILPRRLYLHHGDRWTSLHPWLIFDVQIEQLYCFNGLGPVGGLLAGWLSARGGTGLAFLASGLTGLAITALALTQLRPWPGVRFTAS